MHLRTVYPKQYFSTTRNIKSQLSESKALQISAVKWILEFHWRRLNQSHQKKSHILSPICLPLIKAFWPGRINSLRRHFILLLTTEAIIL